MQVVHQRQQNSSNNNNNTGPMHDIDDEDDVPGGWVKLDRQSSQSSLGSQQSIEKTPNPTDRTLTPHKMILWVFFFFGYLFENNEHLTPFLRTMRPTLYHESRPRFNSNQSFLLVQNLNSCPKGFYTCRQGLN